MKKISLILLGVFVLLFSTNVYALDTTMKVVPFDYFYVTTSEYYNSDTETSVNFLKGGLHNICDHTDVSFCSNGQNTSDFYKHTTESGFGHYSDGSIIPYYRSNFNQQLEFSRYYEGTTDSQGYFTSAIWLTNSRRVDFHSQGWMCNYTDGSCISNMSEHSFRIDFSIRVDFSTTSGNLSNDIKKKIFNSLWVEQAYSNGTNCYSEYNEDYYTINVSCVGTPSKSFDYSIVFNNIKDSSAYMHEDYHFYAELSFSEATLMIKSSGRYEDLIMDDSPNGDVFNDYYKKVEVQSNSYFDKFSNFDFDGLSNVVIAPLAFVRSLSSSHYGDLYTRRNKYSCSRDPLALNVNLFNKIICIPSGQIFWNRGDDIFDSYEASILVSFRQVWNLLLGGFIIYLLSLKLFNVCVDSLDPHKERIETL